MAMKNKMSRATNLVLALQLQLALAVAGQAGGETRAPASPRNIVLWLVDDLGYGDLGFTGHPTIRTPRLDKLARLGKRLTTWYSAYPVCTSSRTAVMTGRQPARLGMPGVINSLSAAVSAPPWRPAFQRTLEPGPARRRCGDPLHATGHEAGVFTALTAARRGLRVSVDCAMTRARANRACRCPRSPWPTS